MNLPRKGNGEIMDKNLTNDFHSSEGHRAMRLPAVAGHSRVLPSIFGGAAKAQVEPAFTIQNRGSRILGAITDSGDPMLHSTECDCVCHFVFGL
jgi:hypothetical protein